MNHYERDEASFARRLYRDNSGESNKNEIEGIPRRDVEKLVYLKRAICHLYYI
jgi:hypothetical protein